MAFFGSFYSNFYGAIEDGNERMVSKYLSEMKSRRLSKTELDDLFQLACINNNLKAAKALKDCGADVDSRDLNSMASALTMAAAYGHEEIIDWLISVGANVNIPSNTGSSPLHFVARNVNQDGAMSIQNQIRIMKKLINNGAKINAITNDGDTPLIQAAGACRVEAVELLLEKGADRNVRNYYGMTALDMALDIRREMSALSYSQLYQLRANGIDLDESKLKRVINLLS